jgi:serine/threonine-protein kinase
MPKGFSVAPGIVLGKYRLGRLLGEGGMATVFEAEHTRLGQKVAIKVLRAELALNEAIVQRFEREGRALARLQSKHVVRVLDVDATPGGAPYLVMEYLEGRDLESEVARRGPLPVGEAIGWILQACEAIAAAHALGIVHRDVKPSNLFLTSDGPSGSRIVKVLDFGIATDLLGSDARITSAESVMGTPLYMAPEQFRSARDVDARTDVWALGATLYELVTGAPPFSGTTSTVGVSIVGDAVPPIMRADVPPEVVAAIMRALEKRREDRFQGVAELAAALAPGADRIVIVPRSSSPLLAETPSDHDHAADTIMAPTPPTSSMRVAVPPPSAPIVASAHTADTQTNSTTALGTAPKRGPGAALAIAAVGVIALGGAALGAGVYARRAVRDGVPTVARTQSPQSTWGAIPSALTDPPPSAAPTVASLPTTPSAASSALPAPASAPTSPPRPRPRTAPDKPPPRTAAPAPPPLYFPP